MKKPLLITLCLFCMLPLQAQLFSGDPVLNKPNFDEQRWSWGYFLGFNTYDFNFDYKKESGYYVEDDIEVDKTIGFNVGLIGNLKLTDHLDLRLEPGVSFNQMSLQFINGEPIKSYREVNQTYVHIPLLLKFSTTRINNFKPFVVGGLSTSINLSSNQNNPDDNHEGQFRMTTNSYYYEIGFGIDFYLYYFKFTPSIRGVFAINDQLVRDVPDDGYTEGIDKMSTRGIFINFTFQ